jgi:hypothetical protein
VTLPYRDFYYPLNVFMHILTQEEGAVPYLHYGLFETPGDSIVKAQERSTELLFSRLPPAPASVLEAGIGLGTTLRRLINAGYEVQGITPDERQIAMIREEGGSSLPIECVRFEDYVPHRHFDVVVFQESSQYIESNALFAKAAELTDRVLVLDEFALGDAVGLHSRRKFLEAAAGERFAMAEEIDLSAEAAPSIDYFQRLYPVYRDRLIADLGLTVDQVEELIEGGVRYRERYRSGEYGYRLFDLRRPNAAR